MTRNLSHPNLALLPVALLWALTAPATDGQTTCPITGTITLNFDSIPLQPLQFSDATNYLADYGVTFIPITPGGWPAIYNSIGAASIPSSGSNVFTGAATSLTGPGAESYELGFCAPLKSVSFTRTGFGSINGDPPWTATALNANGGVVAVVSEGFVMGAPAKTYTLSGDEITVLRIDASNNITRTTFNTPPLDDLTMVAEGLSAPTNLRGIQIGTDGTQIQLTWDYGNDPIDGFRVESHSLTEAADIWDPVTMIEDTQARMVDVTVSIPFQTMKYRVRAYKGNSISEPSNELTKCQIALLTCASGTPCIPRYWPLGAGKDDKIYAVFRPDPGLSDINVAATPYDHFNWISTISSVPAHVLVDPDLTDWKRKSLPPPPFVDPVDGGYYYQYFDENDNLLPGCTPEVTPAKDSLTYYWDELPACAASMVESHIVIDPLFIDGQYFEFRDRPHAPLQPGESIQFVTGLVGVSGPEGTTSSSTLLGIFTWSSNNTISAAAAFADAGPDGSGSGGIFNVAYVRPEDLPTTIRTVLSQAGVQGVPTAPKIDKDAPMTAAFLSGSQGTNGWYTGAVTVSLIATDIDGPSDIASTIYSADGGAALPYSAPFVVSGDAIHTISFGSVDQAGNAELPRPSQNIQIDATPPVVTGSLTTPPNSAGWYNHPVSVSWSGTDNLSGVTGCSAASTYGGPDSATASIAGTCTDNAGNVGSGSVKVQFDETPPVAIINAPSNGGIYVLNAAVASSYACTDNLSGVAGCNGPVPTGSNLSASTLGPGTFTVNAADAAGNASSTRSTYKVQYAPPGSTCRGAPGHAILQPINADGSSVFKQGSTVPVKFRVCDATGASIGAPGVVSTFALTQVTSGTASQTVNEPVTSTTPDTAFRWDSTDQQWIFNVSTKNLTSGSTYGYAIGLNDGTAINFQFGLK